MVNDPRPVHGKDAQLERRHLLFGWWALLGFASLGLGLELLHAFKWGPYLDAGQETRRLMWRLTHAHGTLLALINLALANTVRGRAMLAERLEAVSPALLMASALMPLGFFAGGISAQASDPGLGIALVPLGAALLLFALGKTAWALTISKPERPPKA